MSNFPNAVAYSGGASIEYLKFPISVINHVIATFDPSRIRITTGEITIYVPGSKDNFTFDDLAQIEGNKPGDILVCLSLNKDNRVALINFVENYVQDQNINKDVVKANKMDMFGGILLTYIMHGTLQRLQQGGVNFPKIVRDAVPWKIQDAKGSDICSSLSFFGATFPKVLEITFSNYKLFQSTIRSRLQLGLTGNRVFIIAKAIKARVPGIQIADDWALAMFDKRVLDDQPYYSFHPAYPGNPMKDHSQYVLAYLGNLLAASGVNIDEFVKEEPAIFIKGVVDRMKRKIEYVSEAAPDLRMVRAAVDKKFSVKALERA